MRFGCINLIVNIAARLGVLLPKTGFQISSGRSAARLAHHVRDVGVGCSNHLAPTLRPPLLQRWRAFYFSSIRTNIAFGTKPQPARHIGSHRCKPMVSITRQITRPGNLESGFTLFGAKQQHLIIALQLMRQEWTSQIHFDLMHLVLSPRGATYR